MRHTGYMNPEMSLSWVVGKLEHTANIGYSLLHDKDHLGPSRTEPEGLTIPNVIYLISI